MKSNGGVRGARSDQLPVFDRPAAVGEAPSAGWVAVEDALPETVPGYAASLGYPVRTAGGAIGYGHWRPARPRPGAGGVQDTTTADTSTADTSKAWPAGWIDESCVPLDPQPTHWWR